METNPLRKLNSLGQSIWLDFIDRAILEDGTLAGLIDNDAIAGLTSNPAIFGKAIADGSHYQADIERLRAQNQDREAIYTSLVLDDIGRAADLFRPVYESSGGCDGFVSIEVSPMLARDTRASVQEARELWSRLDRPNIMIKIPGTLEGLEAIHTLLSEGINVNVTLLFSVERYAGVLETYLRALEARHEQGLPLQGVASVASFFLSRIDVKTDAILDAAAEATPAARALRGRAAIASAALAYAHYQSVVGDARWQRLAHEGAKVQRLLWASTSTKDPAYSDTKYVEPLIAPHTVNTLPRATIEAYREQGQPALRIAESIAEADSVMRGLSQTGVDIAALTQALEEEGIRKFIDPYQTTLATLERLLEAG